MYAAARVAVKAYSRVGTETGVIAANPHRLILMLFEGAILALAEAGLHMQRKETAAKGEAISKAIMIINDGLRASLDLKVGGPLAQNLHALYEYMGNRLLVANLNNETAALDEIRHLLLELKEAWAAINKPQAFSPAHGQPPAAPLTYRV